MANEILAVDRVVANRLLNDATLLSLAGGAAIQIDTEFVNQGANAGIYFVVQYPDSTDVNTLQGNHVMTKPMVVVFVCGVNYTHQQLEACANRVVTLLCGASVVDNGILVGGFYKTRTMLGIDNLNGVRSAYIQMVFRSVAFLA